jgi:hypothetical protein
MESVLIALVIIALIATLGVLVAGLISMVRGGQFNAKYSNLLMRARIGTQATTVVLVLIYWLAYARG